MQGPQLPIPAPIAHAIGRTLDLREAADVDVTYPLHAYMAGWDDAEGNFGYTVPRCFIRAFHDWAWSDQIAAYTYVVESRNSLDRPATYFEILYPGVQAVFVHEALVYTGYFEGTAQGGASFKMRTVDGTLSYVPRVNMRAAFPPPGVCDAPIELRDGKRWYNAPGVVAIRPGTLDANENFAFRTKEGLWISVTGDGATTSEKDPEPSERFLTEVIAGASSRVHKAPATVEDIAKIQYIVTKDSIASVKRCAESNYRALVGLPREDVALSGNALFREIMGKHAMWNEAIPSEVSIAAEANPENLGQQHSVRLVTHPHYQEDTRSASARIPDFSKIHETGKVSFVVPRFASRHPLSVTKRKWTSICDIEDEQVIGICMMESAHPNYMGTKEALADTFTLRFGRGIQLSQKYKLDTLWTLHQSIRLEVPHAPGYYGLTPYKYKKREEYVEGVAALYRQHAKRPADAIRKVLVPPNPGGPESHAGCIAARVRRTPDRELEESYQDLVTMYGLFEYWCSDRKQGFSHFDQHAFWDMLGHGTLVEALSTAFEFYDIKFRPRRVAKFPSKLCDPFQVLHGGGNDVQGYVLDTLKETLKQLRGRDGPAAVAAESERLALPMTTSMAKVLQETVPTEGMHAFDVLEGTSANAEAFVDHPLACERIREGMGSLTFDQLERLATGRDVVTEHFFYGHNAPVRVLNAAPMTLRIGDLWYPAPSKVLRETGFSHRPPSKWNKYEPNLFYHRLRVAEDATTTPATTVVTSVYGDGTHTDPFVVDTQSMELFTSPWVTGSAVNVTGREPAREREGKGPFSGFRNMYNDFSPVGNGVPYRMTPDWVVVYLEDTQTLGAFAYHKDNSVLQLPTGTRSFHVSGDMERALVQIGETIQHCAVREVNEWRRIARTYGERLHYQDQTPFVAEDEIYATHLLEPQGEGRSGHLFSLGRDRYVTFADGTFALFRDGEQRPVKEKKIERPLGSVTGYAAEPDSFIICAQEHVYIVAVSEREHITVSCARSKVNPYDVCRVRDDDPSWLLLSEGYVQFVHLRESHFVSPKKKVTARGHPAYCDRSTLYFSSETALHRQKDGHLLPATVHTTGVYMGEGFLFDAVSGTLHRGVEPLHPPGPTFHLNAREADVLPSLFSALTRGVTSCALPVAVAIVFGPLSDVSIKVRDDYTVEAVAITFADGRDRNLRFSASGNSFGRKLPAPLLLNGCRVAYAAYADAGANVLQDNVGLHDKLRTIVDKLTETARNKHLPRARWAHKLSRVAGRSDPIMAIPHLDRELPGRLEVVTENIAQWRPQG